MPTPPCSTPSSAIRASAWASTTPDRCCSGWRPTDPRRSDRFAVWWLAARLKSWAADSTNPFSSRCPTVTATASWCGCATRLEHLFGQRPDGAWLAERVWEPSLAYDLAAAGYRWTVLDDNHLRGASIREDEMWTLVHHGRPRPPPDRLRDRAGSALSHPVQARGRPDLVPRRAPDATTAVSWA